MNNNKFKSTFQQPFIPMNNRIQSKIIIESRSIDKNIIQRLFLLCTDGSISAIKDYILKFGITNNDMVDENGQSNIHIIIQNDNLNQGEKIELLNFFKNRGSIIESYDTNNNNYTPLHIASQKKLTKVAALLIESGHNVNALDSSNKTPIFYAITGLEEDCPIKKVDYFIKQKNKFNLNLSDITKITDEILNIFTQNAELNQFIKHIYTTSEKYDHIFKNEIEDILKKNNELIIKILSDNSIENKDSKIKEIILKTKQNIIKTIQNKLSLSTKLYSIGITEGGWSPDDKLQNSILKIKDITEFQNELNTEAKSKIDNLKEKYKNNVNSLKNTYTSIKKKISSHNDIINNILFLNYLYFFMMNIYNGTYVTNPLQSTLPNGPFGINGGLPNITQLVASLEDKTNPFFENKNLEININTNEPINLPIWDIHNIDSIHNVLLGLRFDKIDNDIKLINSLINYFTQLIIPTGETIIPIPLPVQYEPYTKLTSIILEKLNEIYTQIDINFNTIDYDNLEDIYTVRIPFLQNKFLEYILYIISLESQQSKLDTSLQNIKNELDNYIILIKNSNLNILFIDEKNNPIEIPGESIYSKILNIMNTINFTFDKDIEKLYTNAKDLYSIINDLIMYINTKTSQRIIMSYYNNFTNFDTIFTTNSINFANIFKYHINTVKDIPEKYSDFKKLLNPTDLNLTKQSLIENFFIQFTMYDYNIFYKDPNINPTINPKIGYNISSLTYPYPLTLLYGNNTNTTTTLTLEGNVDVPPKGIIGISNKLENVIKSSSIIASISEFVDIHFNYLKYFIIRKIIKFTYDLIANPNSDPVNKTYQDLCKKFRLNIKSKLNIKDDNDNGVFYTIIGIIVDKILIQNILNALQIGVNTFSYDLFESNKIDKIRKSLLYKRSLSDDKVVPIPYIDTNIKLEIPNLETDILKIFLDSRKSYAVSYAENVEIKLKSNLFKVYSQGIFSNSVAPRCFKFDFDLIKLLIDNRANLYMVDKDGSTPFFYCVETNNSELVEQMYTLMPRKFITYQNLYGMTPFDIAVGQLLSYTKSFDIELIQDIIETVNKDISKKTTNPSPMRYQYELFMMFILMLNYLFFMMSYEYSMDWTFDKKKKIDELLSNPNPALFPFDSIIEELKMTGDYAYIDSVVNSELISKELNDSYVNNNAKIKSLEAELKSPNLDPLRKTIVENLLTKTESIKNSSFTDIMTNVKKVSLVTYEIDTSANKLVKPIIDRKSNLLPSSDPVEIFDSFFNSVLNINSSINSSKKSIKYLDSQREKVFFNLWKTKLLKSKELKSYELDYKTYIEIWKIYIKSQNPPQNQIINIMRLIKLMFDPKSTISNIQESITIISNYFTSNIKRFCIDYTELDIEYNGINYALNNILRIIKHCVRHTMVVNLFNLIQKILRQEISLNNKSNNEEIYEEELKGIFDTAIIDNVSFTDYLFDTFIDKIIKNILNIYESDTDPDKSMSLKDNLQYLNNFLMRNSIRIGLNENSQSISLLNDKIYPYFETYFEINIKKLKELADAYINILLGFTDAIKIVNIIQNTKK
jgi:hypothetical protein